ncbi:hypothetical protein TIFTF001_027297 [Ficus carica]|uniref:Uncharacterized protein n=1 Tax=Ficus carica TaxID=3494 RepID=A0AA88DMQ8_FICCA|nr:hypothetical protein TIFTF001_027297 [Ficus carica]
MIINKDVLAFGISHDYGQGVSTFTLKLIILVIKEFSFEVDHACDLAVHIALELIMLIIKECSFGADHAYDRWVLAFGVNHVMIEEYCSFGFHHNSLA